MKLNQKQSEAVGHKNGPCLVLAGPGSGKTTVIVQRIEYLLEKQRVKPDEILVITFTKYAAREMKERFLRHTENRYKTVTFGTFHGIYYGILKWAYGIHSGNLMSEEEKYQLLRYAADSCDLDLSGDRDFLQDLAGEIGIVKNSRTKLEEYEASCCPPEAFQEIFRKYEQKRKERKKLDFDDILTACCHLFEKRKDLLQKWQERYRYILIDEFQDINQIQYDVIRMLASPQNQVFAVGDDDQSIYGFRGAKSELLFRFLKDYPGAEKIVLDVNYRSTGHIVRMSGKVIRQNQLRFPKEIRSVQEAGRPVHVQEVKDTKEEAEYIAAEIEKRLAAGMQEEQIAVLFRIYNGFEIVVEELAKKGIDFWMRETLFNIYHHFIGENLTAYFRLALGGRSRQDFLVIMNRPNRYISRDSLESSEISFEALRNFYCDKEWMQDRIDQLDVDLRMIRNMTPYGAIQYLRKSVGYDEFLKKYAQKNGQDAEKLFEILGELEERAKGLKTLEDWMKQQQDYTDMLQEQKRRMDRKEKKGVQVMTLHGAKGLEFETVFITGANEGVIPYRKMQTKEEIEEERRLFYVGMTRAKRELIISCPAEKNGRELSPSRFVSDLLAEKV